MNEIISLEPIKTEHIESLTIDCKKILQNSEALEISTQVELDNANSALRIVKTKLKELEEDRKKLTQPLESVKKSIIAKYKPAIEMLEKAESLIKRGMIVFTEKIEAERRKQEEELRRKMLEKAEKAEAKGKVEKAKEIRQQAELTTVVSKIETPKGVSYREIWKYKIVDETLLERQYLIPNHDMLSKMATATKGAIEVKGVQFYSEKIIASR